MDMFARQDALEFLLGRRYKPKCRCTGWYCEHDGITKGHIKGLGMHHEDPPWRKAETEDDDAGNTVQLYWCTREEFIDALKAVHGEDEILSLLLELEAP